MSDQRHITIEEAIAGAGENEKKEKRDRKDWVAFVESDAVYFLCAHDIEKMTLDDGEGNKADRKSVV